MNALKWSLPLVVLLFSSCSHLMNNAKNHEKAKIHLQRAVDQFNERDYTKAIEATQDAIKLDSDFPAAYNHLGLIYLETKRLRKGEEAFKKALSLQADYPEVFNNLGVLYNREEKYHEAIPYLEKALASDNYSTPENAFTNLGHAYFRLGNLTRAKAYHQKALDVSPQFCLAHKNMADIYVKEKNYQKAADYYERAMIQCPLFQESQYKLALTLMRLGQRMVAKTQFEKLVERHKSGPYVERSQEVLKILQ